MTTYPSKHLPEDTDWREALESAINSMHKHDLCEWELRLVARRVENEIARLRSLVSVPPISSVASLPAGPAQSNN